MLNAEQVKERLAAYENPTFLQKRLKRLASLGTTLNSIGQIIVQGGPEWEGLREDWRRRQMAELKAAASMGQMASKERLRLFSAIFPCMPETVEATWNLFQSLPYQSGENRRPFRIPHGAAFFRRFDWIQSLARVTQRYDQDAAWLAAWAPYLGYGYPDAIGYLCAGAIDRGGSDGQKVFDTLVALANGSHEIGVMGRHVVRGLLCSSHPQSWEVIERLLLAAQREEGLRQVILESVDEANPQAFRRLLGLILDHNLLRFSATVRAAGVWMGLSFDAAPPRLQSEILSQVRDYLDQPDRCVEAIQTGIATEAYIALWALAFEDASTALPHAFELYQSTEVERRFVAVHFIAQSWLHAGLPKLMEAIEDPDLRVAGRAVTALLYYEYSSEELLAKELFEHLENLIGRLKQNQISLKPIVWEWNLVTIDMEAILAGLVCFLGDRSPKRLLAYLPEMSPSLRSATARAIIKLGQGDVETRQALFTLAGDPSSSVRETVLQGLRGFSLTQAETIELEGLLTRLVEDLRRGVLQLLLGLPDALLLESAARLLAARSENQRRAGLELLRDSIQKGRQVAECRRMGAELARNGQPGDAETRLLNEVLAENVEHYTLADALGLLDPGKRTPPVGPTKASTMERLFRKGKLGTPAAAACLKSLDALIEAHRTDPVEIVYGDSRKTELLGNLTWGLQRPDPTLSLEQGLARFPLRESVHEWYTSRPPGMKDDDGMELIRAFALSCLCEDRITDSRRYIGVLEEPDRKLFDVELNFKISYLQLVRSVLDWVMRIYPLPDEVDFLLAAVEDSFSRISKAELIGQREIYGSFQRTLPGNYLIYLRLAQQARAYRPENWTPAHHTRLWQLVRWIDEPCPGILRQPPSLEDALYAFQAGAATQDDLFDLLFEANKDSWRLYQFEHLRTLSKRHIPTKYHAFSILRELVEACRERIISIETRRGDLPTAATAPASAIRSVPGIRNLFRLLAALGKTDIDRVALDQSRQATLSHLIRVSYPTDEDTPAAFAAQAKAIGLPQRRLVELAVFAPQWAHYVEYALGWDKFAEAVFWVYAHTKDRQWSVEQELRKKWAAEVSEYTPLTGENLLDGAVDVAWFHQVYDTLGEARWNEIYRAAGLGAQGSGHIRARIFADAMLARLSSEDIIKRCMEKRHQDSVRALGLVPLPEGVARQAEILRRYETLQEFRRTSKQYGSQRQASEKLAVEIGMANLARTAGYIDPQRLEWAMEIETVRDLAKGPVQLQVGDVLLELSIDLLGEPQLIAARNGKELKVIPPALKKDPGVAALVERKQQLERQLSRMRASLEQAMCRGDEFHAAEVSDLFHHPILRVMLEQLVFAGQVGMGYPVEEGRALISHSGNIIPLDPGDLLRIAHPVDFLNNREWHLWQHECFVEERIQPFKQVFRELYVLTAAEKDEGNLSRRYAGQQVNPRQALALFGRRGWVTSPNEGVHKTYHALDISGRVGFLQDMFTPAEVEGLTLEQVIFTRRGEYAPLPLEDIPPRIFSEVMRDLDLIVSVAHAGGVDPEASASSVEARATLISETCTLLKISNVEIKSKHAIIAGNIANYTVHLGSAVVHKQPGGALCIVPVHAQQRGRLFLPFIDSDPKTAEVLSKVILLARDHEIKDPSILEQILK